MHRHPRGTLRFQWGSELSLRSPKGCSAGAQSPSSAAAGQPMPVARRHTVNDRGRAIANIPLQSTHCCCMKLSHRRRRPHGSLRSSRRRLSARRGVRHLAARHTASGSARSSLMTAWTMPGYDDWTAPGYAEERPAGPRGVWPCRRGDQQDDRPAYGDQVLRRKPGPRHRVSPGTPCHAELLMSLDSARIARVFAFVEQPGQGAALVTARVEGSRCARCHPPGTARRRPRSWC